MHRNRFASVLHVSLFIIFALAVQCIQCDINSVNLEGKVIAPRNELLKGQIRVILNGGEYVTYVKNNGGFMLHKLALSMSHIIEIHCPGIQFPQIRIDVSRSGKVRAIVNDGSRKFVKSDPVLQILPIGKQEYFQKYEPYNVLGLLKNPMVIMMVFGLFVSFIFPKIVDQEAMKEYQDSMKQNENDLKKMWSSFKGEKKDGKEVDEIDEEQKGTGKSSKKRQ